MQLGKVNATTNKLATAQSQCKPTDKKNHIQTKDKSDTTSKTDSSKSSTQMNKINSVSKHESIVKGTPDSVKQSVSTAIKTIPKTAPVPVPQSPTASSR